VERVGFQDEYRLQATFSVRKFVHLVIFEFPTLLIELSFRFFYLIAIIRRQLVNS